MVFVKNTASVRQKTAAMKEAQNRSKQANLLNPRRQNLVRGDAKKGDGGQPDSNNNTNNTTDDPTRTANKMLSPQSIPVGIGIRKTSPTPLPPPVVSREHSFATETSDTPSAARAKYVVFRAPDVNVRDHVHGVFAVESLERRGMKYNTTMGQVRDMLDAQFKSGGTKTRLGLKTLQAEEVRFGYNTTLAQLPPHAILTYTIQQSSGCCVVS